MELNFNRNTVDYFSMVTRYDVSTYLELYSIFIQSNQPQILQYYRERNANPDVTSFDFMEKLINEAIKLDNLIKIHKNAFGKVDHWELLVMLEEMRDKLETVKNTSKWIGSSKAKNSWHSTSIQSSHVLRQNETLEGVSLDLNGKQGNNQDDWVDIAMENDLLENDYSVDGGNRIQLSKGVATSPNYFIRSVIDTLVDQTMYGLDIDRKITFENDDMKVLGHNDTVKQSIDILILLKKGDVPEFPNFGIDADLSVGGNAGQLFHSAIVRQLAAVFSTDDSLRNFNVIRALYENGDLHIDYSVNTMYNLTVSSTQKIT